jgi:hypothetical protein
MTPDAAFTPSHRELTNRLAVLDAILDAAPLDWRPLIAELRTGQLSFDDTDTLLADAATGQDSRRRWILEHWPRVVEHHEATATLQTGTWGPDPGLLDDLLNGPISSTLADAIHSDQRWLRAALCALADPDDATLDASAVDTLENLAKRSDPLSALGQLDLNNVGIDEEMLEL